MPAPVTLPAGTPYFGSADVDLFRTTTRGRPVWVFGSAINLDDYEVELDVRWPGGAFQVRTTDVGDALNGTLTILSAADIDVGAEVPPDNSGGPNALRWEITALAIAAMPLGRVARGRIYLTHKADGFRRLHRDLFFIVH